jgi:hypothetical protein
MLRKVFERIPVDLLVEPLSDLVEERLKAAWSLRPCPRCGKQGLMQTWEGCDRVRCRSCGCFPRYTHGTPFAQKELADGKLLLIFVLYVDTWLSTRAIARLFEHDYHTISDAVDEFETAFIAGFPRVWEAIKPCVGGPTQVDETPQVCSGFVGQDPPREGLDRKGSVDPGRSRWSGEPGDELSVAAACRGPLRVIRALKGTQYEDELERVIEGTNDLSQKMGEVWSDALNAYQAMEYDHKVVVHDDEFVTDEGVHTNQVECLWSIMNPWLKKFRGLSKDGMENAVQAFGFMRSFTLIKAPIHGVIDCFALSSLQDST